MTYNFASRRYEPLSSRARLVAREPQDRDRERSVEPKDTDDAEQQASVSLETDEKRAFKENLETQWKELAPKIIKILGDHKIECNSIYLGPLAADVPTHVFIGINDTNHDTKEWENAMPELRKAVEGLLVPMDILKFQGGEAGLC